MNETASCEPQVDEALPCDRFGSVEMAEQKLCPDCLQEIRSCCPEFEENQDRCAPRQH